MLRFTPYSWPASLHQCRPPEFESSSSGAAAVSKAAEQLAALGLAESDSEGDEAEAAGSSRDSGLEGAQPAGGSGNGTQRVHAQQRRHQDDAAAAGAAETAEGVSDGEYSSSEDDLPPIPRFNNRKIIEYQVSDSDSDEE